MLRLKLGHQPKKGTQKLVERGEADVDLELGAAGTHHVVPHVLGMRRGGLQQGRLPDPGFARYQERPASGYSVSEEAPQRFQLDRSSNQGPSRLSAMLLRATIR